MSTILSIIVPVYKVENYLESCVYSIINQTLTNFELILVDDGSPDRSSEICDQLGKTDDRIKVVHKDNGGVSSARNIGLNLASGKWVTFIDADDCISPNFIEGLFAPIFDDNSEVQFVQGGCKCWDGLSNYRVEQSYIDYCSNNASGIRYCSCFPQRARNRYCLPDSNSCAWMRPGYDFRSFMFHRFR